MSSRKPVLALSTSAIASFPAEALRSAASVRTPQSAISASWREQHSSGLTPTGLPSAGLPSAGLSSACIHSPLALIKTEDGFLKTPITPPMGYVDFLRIASPVAPSPGLGSMATVKGSKDISTRDDKTEDTKAKDIKDTTTKDTSAKDTTATDTITTIITDARAKDATAKDATASDKAKDKENYASSSTATSAASSDEDTAADVDSVKKIASSSPSTATSSGADCSCGCERAYKSPRVSRLNTSIPQSASSSSNGSHPLSAPLAGHAHHFPSLKIPISPALSTASRVDSSPVRSPFSASATLASPLDWESVSKARYMDGKPASHHALSNCTLSSGTTASRTNIRYIREVVTRTVTYTPRMNPPPKGKKRKAECSGGSSS